MPLIYVTGRPGAGKSSVRQALLQRGISAYGGGEDNLASFYNKATGERVDGWVPADARTPDWRQNHDWRISRDAIAKLKAEAQDEPVYLCAVADNEADLWGDFEKVIVLTIDESTMKQRLATRTNNDVGKAQNEVSDILAKTATREAAHPPNVIRIDATQPLEVVIEDIITVN